MQQALDLAHHAEDAGEVPVGAVLVLDDEIIGSGYNQQITSSDPTAHAEILALKDAATRTGNYRIPSSTLYVTIEPCTMCAGALVHARVARLVFGALEPRAGAVISSNTVLDNAGLNHRVEVTSGVMEADCGQLIREFFRAKRS